MSPRNQRQFKFMYSCDFKGQHTNLKLIKIQKSTWMTFQDVLQGLCIKEGDQQLRLHQESARHRILSKKYLNFVLSELFSNQIIKIQAFWYFFSFMLPSANRTNKAKLIFDKEKQVITLTINNTFKEINHCFVKMFFVGSSEQPRNFS